MRWKVVFFRGSGWTTAAHGAFARRFGEPVVPARRGSASPADFPEVETTADRLELGGRFGMEHEEWLRRRRHTLLGGRHCDHGDRVDPPAATVLRAETVPPYGGDTTWSNPAAAYAGLSAPVREFVAGLRAEHRLGVGHRPGPGDSTRSASAGSPAAWPSGTTAPPSTWPPATTPTSATPGSCTG
nr:MULTISPECIES: TauD/TfdA family dioxygenase [Streptomyces]